VATGTTTGRDALPHAIRHRFPLLEHQVYLNSCSQGVLSDAVRAAYTQYLRDWDERGAPWEYWMERTEAVRTSFAGLIRADNDEIAVTASVSAGVNAVASGLRKAEGRDRIVVSDFEFPTVGQIWHAQEERGYTITHVPQGDAPVVPLEAFDAAIDERTALVAITQVCYRNGACIDVEGVVRLAHARGALVLLDSYQAVGSMPIDVHALGVDLLVAGALKYLLASAGLGFLYCRRELFEQLRPTATGWFADADVFAMDIQDYSPAADARRFQAGTPPIPSIYAGIAGIELMKEIGIAETRAHVAQLNETLVAGVAELGGSLATPLDPAQRGALVAIRSVDEHAHVAALAADGILTSSRDGNLRVSAHCYNTHEDIETLLAGLKRHRSLLASA
jgi:selenocysteine lyase/cysteine desulfurase